MTRIASHQRAHLVIRGRDESHWRFHGDCRFYEPELFYSRDGEPAGDRIRREQVAKSVCQGCPVRQPCLDHALRTGVRFGLWGGNSERDRIRLRKCPTI